MRLFPLLAVFLATPALAQQTPAEAPEIPVVGRTVEAPGVRQPVIVIVEPVGMMIAGFDADGDGRVSREEFDAGLRRSFDAIDTQQTGALGYIAFSDWAERWMGDRNTLPSPFEVDRDGDNKITYGELADRFATLFTQFDKNKDGVLERKELTVIRPPAYVPPKPDGKGPPGRGRRGN